MTIFDSSWLPGTLELIQLSVLVIFWIWSLRNLQYCAWAMWTSDEEVIFSSGTPAFLLQNLSDLQLLIDDDYRLKLLNLFRKWETQSSEHLQYASVNHFPLSFELLSPFLTLSLPFHHFVYNFSEFSQNIIIHA